MNRSLTVLAIAVATAVLVAWQIGQRTNHDAIPIGDTPQPQPPFSTAELEPESVVGSQAPEAPSVPERTTPTWYVQADDSHCDRVFINDPQTGNVVEALDCDPPFEEIDPYASWDDESLASMAYGDSHAAEVLGLRLILSDDPGNETLGLGLLYRSVALSADPTTFRKAIGARYAYVSVNGKPQLKNLEQMLVFSVIGEALGDRTFNSGRIERALKSFDVEQQDIDAIRSGAREVLRQMAALQAEVTGNTSIREAIENA